jgi:ABC-2 type transport system permease protein
MARIGMQEQFQYRVANYFYMVGMIAEPVVYLVVWSSIARSNGGSIDGYTAGTFAAYYIVWTLVRNMNIVFTPFGWEERIREGTLSAHLARPIHPIHYDLGSFAGWKVVVIILWLPIALALSLIFRPELHPRPQQMIVFFIAIWGAYLIRSMVLWILGMITFWTTRISALFEAYFAAELLLSGRVLPLTLMPQWAQNVSRYLPFRWTFGYPITALVGPISDRDLYLGLLAQLAWIAVGACGVSLLWRRAVKRYTAVAG